jgi:hypothetical protein
MKVRPKQVTRDDGRKAAAIFAGGATELTAKLTIRGDALLEWRAPALFPGGFKHYEIRIGKSWGASTLLDVIERPSTTVAAIRRSRKPRTRYLSIDVPVGSMTYWVAVVDRNGNRTTPVSVSLDAVSLDTH